MSTISEMRNHTRSTWKVALLGALLIGTISCGADSSSKSIQSIQSTQSSEEASITDFTATLVGEGSVNLQTELQKSPVAMWFWAPG